MDFIMRMLNAHTFELDDPSVAVSEILSQLDIPNNLLSNSVGIITCSYDFIETGMVEEICRALPFETVGCTTLTNACNDQSGTMLLCLSVLTADDCEFSTAISQPIADKLNEIPQQAYGSAVSAHSEPVKLIFAFLPMVEQISGEFMLNALDEASLGVPIFGTIACDFDTAHYSNSFTIHNSSCTRDCISLLLVSGNVNPRFIVTPTSQQNLHKQQAIITSSDGSILKGVNGMSAGEYFASIGMIQGNGFEAVSSVPFVINYNDGSPPVARAIYSLNEEDGSVACGGVMPTGATLSIGRMDVEDILSTAENSMSSLMDSNDLNGIFTFPCMGRNMVLGMDDPMAEIKVTQKAVGLDIPLHLAYSGGEVCPTYFEAGTVNRYHNFTFIACAI